jgi:hypothetical protein
MHLTVLNILFIAIFDFLKEKRKEKERYMTIGNI